jgi:hypothetical protein
MQDNQPLPVTPQEPSSIPSTSVSETPISKRIRPDTKTPLKDPGVSIKFWAGTLEGTLNTPYSPAEIEERIEKLGQEGWTSFETINPDRELEADKTYIISGNTPIVIRALLPIYNAEAIAKSRDGASPGKKPDIQVVKG